MKSTRLKHLSVKSPKRKQTLGQLITENREKDIPGHVGVLELVREANMNYEKDLLACVSKGKQAFKGDFFPIILFKHERLFNEVHRLLFFPRISCPTPTYSQIVYKYHKDTEHLEFLWVIPDKDTCVYYCDNALEVDPSERDLLNFILEFRTGALDRKAQLLNKENPDQPRIILVPA